MPKFRITIGAHVPVYGTLEVEAADMAAAMDIGRRIATQGWNAPDLPIGDFEPEWDAMTDFDMYAVEDIVETEPAGA